MRHAAGPCTQRPRRVQDKCRRHLYRLTRNPPIRPQRLAVIGLGAIGGSVAWQARSANVPEVVAVERRRADAVAALQCDAITELADTPAQAAERADLVVIALPPRGTISLLQQASLWAGTRAVLTDVASVKTPVLEAARAAGVGARFAGGHPLAGTHRTGFTAARADLFPGCVVYVVPSNEPGGEAAASAVGGFWRDVMRAEPVLINAEAHDRQLAWTSHLPQAVSSALARALARSAPSGVSYGTGARDTTRLAASDPAMWAEILLLNSAAVVAALDAQQEQLAELRRLVVAQSAAELEQWLADAARFRSGLDR